MAKGIGSMDGEGKKKYVFDSKCERKVATFLHEINIFWQPQPHILVIDSYGKDRIVHPDLYLPDLGIYVEVCGRDGKDRIVHPDLYLPDLGIYVEVCGRDREKYYNEKKKMYNNNHIPIIFVQTYKGERKWKYFLISKLKQIQLQRQELLSRIDELQGFKQEILVTQ